MTIGKKGTTTTLTPSDGKIVGATLLGAIQLEGAVELFDCKQGPTGVIASKGREETPLWIKKGSGALVVRHEVSGSLWHANVYATADNFEMHDCYLHMGGVKDTVQSNLNLDHGLYWAEGSGGLVQGGLIEGNRDRGAQLYPSVVNAKLRAVEVEGNGTGVQLGSAAAGCDVEDCVISLNKLYGLRSYELIGKSNRARYNRVYGNKTNIDAKGIALSGNLEAAL